MLTLQFLSANCQQYICDFKWSGNLYEFLCLCFSRRASSRIFYQITKNPNCSFEENKHSSARLTCLSGRYVTDGANLTRKYDSEGYIDFSVAKLGFVINLKRSILKTVKKIEFLGLHRNTQEMALTVSLRRETGSYNSTMSKALLSTNNLMLSLTKLIALILSTAQVILPGKISFPPTGTDIKSKKAGELPVVCYSWELSHTRTSLVDREHKAIQW